MPLPCPSKPCASAKHHHCLIILGVAAVLCQCKAQGDGVLSPSLVTAGDLVVRISLVMAVAKAMRVLIEAAVRRLQYTV
jgi:hypothetical protein